VTEFLGACFFVFAKHPYDVGDEVGIEKVKLIVLEIRLMHTVFRRKDDEVQVQMPDTKAREYWIDNTSRTECEDEGHNDKDAKKDKSTRKKRTKTRAQRKNCRVFQTWNCRDSLTRKWRGGRRPYGPGHWLLARANTLL
jgi:hypothetical protein